MSLKMRISRQKEKIRKKVKRSVQSKLLDSVLFILASRRDILGTGQEKDCKNA